MSWLGIDIGGANLKVANGIDFAATHSFEMWKTPELLVHRLRQLLAESPASEHLVATMTGELADCFESKAAGVSHIVCAMEQAAAGRHLRFYSTEGRFVTPQVAIRTPLQVAAANWHALARFSQRFFAPSSSGILVDIGSTTTDIVPSMPDPREVCGETDTQRLASGSLVYTGVVRSPICAVVQHVPYRGQELPVAHEWFATMRDVYLLTGDLPEDNLDHGTADGRPATKAFARTRVGRVICADATEFHHKDAAEMAQAVRLGHEAMIRAAIEAMRAHVQSSKDVTFVISGKGEFLARRAIADAAPIISVSQELGPQVSVAASAHAIVVLARESRGESRQTREETR